MSPILSRLSDVHFSGERRLSVTMQLGAPIEPLRIYATASRETLRVNRFVLAELDIEAG
jgi:hypothetical protein